MLINKTISGMYGGISQQSATLRLDVQSEDEENVYATLVKGMRKRPPTEFVSLLDSMASSNAFIHSINRDSNERYLVFITDDIDNPIEIFTLDGTKCSVRYGRLDDNLSFTEDLTLKSYVASSDPQTDFRAITITDHTIIVNTSKIGVTKETPENVRQPQAVIYVKKGVADTDYRVFVNNVNVASYTSGATTSPATWKTDVIADSLYAAISANLAKNVLTINVSADTTTITTINAYQPADPASNIRVTLEQIDNPSVQVQACSLPLVWTYLGYTYANPNYAHRWDLNVSATATAIYSALFDGVNASYWEVNKANNSIIVRKIGASNFNCAVNLTGRTTGIARTLPTTAQWNAIHYTATDYIVIQRLDAGDFSMKVMDSWGNQALVGIKDKLQSFTDLPAKVVDGFAVEITGDPENHFDNYYVKYSTNTDAVSGTWIETVKPGLCNTFEETTLPHRLVRTDLNEFTFAPVNWEKRAIGDDYSAPMPSFIGNKINDVFFHKNRLGFLAGENVILSQSGDYFDFFPSTATDILDDDPIDVAASNTQVSVLKNAIPFPTGLLLFSDQRQFILTSGQNTLTVRTISIDPTTAYETDTKCRPVGAGSMVYFISPNGEHSALREYFVQPDSLTDDAEDVTAHVQTFLPKNMNTMTSSTAHNLIFCLSNDDPTHLYVYKYFWRNNEKVQSAWTKWTVTDTVLNIVVIDNYLYLTMRDSVTHQISLCRLNLETVVTTGDLIHFQVLLDKRVTSQGVYDIDSNKTTWTLPYHLGSHAQYQVVDWQGNQVLTAQQGGTNVVEALGEYDLKPCYIGQVYNMRYRFSEWFVKSPNTNVALVGGKLQIKNLFLEFTDTGYFTIAITPAGRNVPTYQDYTATVIGTSQLGVPSLISSQKSFVVMSNSKGCIIEIQNNTYLPSEFQTAELEGLYVQRSRSI